MNEGCTCVEPLEKSPGDCPRCVWRRDALEAFFGSHPALCERPWVPRPVSWGIFALDWFCQNPVTTDTEDTQGDHNELVLTQAQAAGI